jgi:hypothetical protein
MGLFRAIWAGVTWLGRMLALPVVATARSLRGPGSLWRWLFHFVLVALVLTGLGYLNYRLDLGQYLGHAPAPIFRRFWLPLYGLLLYVLCWLVWWIRDLLRPEMVPSEMADLDTAWDEAVQALDRAGIRLTELPVFLVLGKTAGDELEFFRLAGVPFLVEQAPRRPEAPLHVYASSEAVFVCCPGASLLARHADLLAAANPNVPAAAVLAPAPAEAEWKKDSLPPPLLARERLLGKEDGAAEGGQAVGLELELEAAPLAAREAYLLKDVAAADRLRARLKHLGARIARERRPYCPVNGILCLLPYATTATDELANQTGTLWHEDLAAARDVLQVYCPVFALVCDLEGVPGFREFAARVPEEQAVKSLGLPFPMVPDPDPRVVPELFDRGVRWMCDALFPSLIYRVLPAAGGGDPVADAGNARLYDLLAQLRDRRERFSRLLTLGVASGVCEPLLFGGCYFGATGGEGPRRAFVARVFRRLVESQNAVAWTPAALAEDAACRRWSRVLVAAYAVFLAGLVALGLYFYSL